MRDCRIWHTVTIVQSKLLKNHWCMSCYSQIATQLNGKQNTHTNNRVWHKLFVCWSLTSLCHSNGHIETMPARVINPFTALTRIRSQFLRTQWSTSNRQRVDTTTPQTAEPSGLAVWHKCCVFVNLQFSVHDPTHLHNTVYLSLLLQFT